MLEGLVSKPARFKAGYKFQSTVNPQETSEINTSMLLGHGSGGFRWSWNAGTKMAMGNAETVPETLKLYRGY